MLSCMSNAKWRKLFGRIDGLTLPRCRIKFLKDERIYTESTPQIDHLNEDYTKDCFTCGPFYFRDIEWIEWPARWEISRKNRDEILSPSIRTQNIVLLGEAVRDAGIFDTEQTDDALRIYGYRDK